MVVNRQRHAARGGTLATENEKHTSCIRTAVHGVNAVKPATEDRTWHAARMSLTLNGGQLAAETRRETKEILGSFAWGAYDSEWRKDITATCEVLSL